MKASAKYNGDQCVRGWDGRDKTIGDLGYGDGSIAGRRSAVRLWARKRALRAASHSEGICIVSHGRCSLCIGRARGLRRGWCGVWGELGARRSCASRTGFVVLLFTISIASFLLEPAGNAFSRHFEHQADVYGQEAIHGIVPDPQKTAVAAFNALGECLARRSESQPVHRVLAVQPSQHATPRQLCAALRSVGERRAWGVLQELGIRNRVS